MKSEEWKPVKCIACGGFSWEDSEDVQLIEQTLYKKFRHRDPFDCIRELNDRLESHNL